MTEYLTELPGWPKEYQKYEYSLHALLRTILMDEQLRESLDFSKFETIIDFIKRICSKEEELKKLKTLPKTQAFKVISRWIAVRKVRDSHTIIQALNKTITMIDATRQCSESDTQKSKVLKFDQYQEFVDYKVSQAIYNQKLSQLLYQVGIAERSHNSIIFILFLEALSNHFHWLDTDGQCNMLANRINGARAQSGIAQLLRNLGGLNIFPNTIDREEIKRWDVVGGVDFISIFENGAIIFVSCQGKAYNKDNSPYKTVRMRKKSYAPMHETILEEAIWHMNMQKYPVPKKLYVKCLEIVVTTHPFYSNHTGAIIDEGLNQSFVEQLNACFTSRNANNLTD